MDAFAVQSFITFASFVARLLAFAREILACRPPNGNEFVYQ